MMHYYFCFESFIPSCLNKFGIFLGFIMDVRYLLAYSGKVRKGTRLTDFATLRKRGGFSTPLEDLDLVRQ